MGQVGRYKLLAQLGRGGMATVYLARPSGESTARLLALKILHEHMLGDRSAVRGFLREARLASQIQHVNVVPILETGSHEGRPYIVMDYIEGCSFSDMLSASPDERPPSLIISVLLDALDGLSAVHELKNAKGESLKMVHRDVSPANLLIGVDGACRIADFGVARADEISQTISRSVHGTPGYMAPEIIAGHDVDARADVFSIGVILWNALTGLKIFRGKTITTTLFNVMKRRVPPPSSVGLQPPRCLDAVCLTAMQRDATLRFPSAAAMADALRGVAAQHGLQGTRVDVANFIGHLFEKRLSERRHAIAELLDRQAVRTVDASSDMSVVPHIVSAAPETDIANANQSRAPTIDELRVSQSLTPLDYISDRLDASITSLADEDESAALLHGHRSLAGLPVFYWMAGFLLLVVGVIGGASWTGGLRNPQPEPTPTVGNRKPSLVGTREVSPPDAVLSPRSEPSDALRISPTTPPSQAKVPPAASGDDTEVIDDRESELKSPPPRPKAPTAKPPKTVEPESRPRASPSLAPQPAKASARERPPSGPDVRPPTRIRSATSTSTTDEIIERNPYLRTDR